MELDAKVCLCFRVTRRKLLNFIRLEHPRVASQLSQCGGAGTGCGWCVPYLEKLFAGREQAAELDALSDEQYASAGPNTSRPARASRRRRRNAPVSLRLSQARPSGRAWRLPQQQ